MRAALWAGFGIVVMVLAPLPLVLGLYPLVAFFAFGIGSLAALVCFLVAVYEWRSPRNRAA